MFGFESLRAILFANFNPETYAMRGTCLDIIITE